MVMILPGTAEEGSHDPDSLEADRWCLEDLGSPERRGSRIDRAPGMNEEEIGLAGFICAILILGFTGTGFIIRDIGPQQANTEMSDCARIEARAERLACFDKFALEQATEPAKGAAPQLSSTQ